VLLLVVSETGLVYTFTTPKLQPLVTKPEGKNLIQVRCNMNLTPSHGITNPP
jgi:MADS-box transcription factor